MKKRVWLITGCSTGFGRELVKLVAAKGEIAIGTVRKAEQMEALEALHPENAKAVVLDVQEQGSIDKAAAEI
ncbi:MAG: NAD(P)-dependent dehydrogenase (short-subunit alcohol dehydrogenase family), partial [Cyclobacteriaceae bacterium]